MLEFMKYMDGNNKFLSSKSKSFFYHQSQNYIIPSISEAFFDRQSWAASETSENILQYEPPCR